MSMTWRHLDILMSWSCNISNLIILSNVRYSYGFSFCSILLYTTIYLIAIYIYLSRLRISLCLHCKFSDLFGYNKWYFISTVNAIWWLMVCNRDWLFPRRIRIISFNGDHQWLIACTCEIYVSTKTYKHQILRWHETLL